MRFSSFCSGAGFVVFLASKIPKLLRKPCKKASYFPDYREDLGYLLRMQMKSCDKIYSVVQHGMPKFCKSEMVFKR